MDGEPKGNSRRQLGDPKVVCASSACLLAEPGLEVVCETHENPQEPEVQSKPSRKLKSVEQ